MLEQRSSLCLFRCNLDTKFMFCRRHMNKYKHLKWIHNNLLLLVLLEAIFLLTFLFSIGRCSTWQCGSVNQERSNRLCPQMPDDKVRWAGRWLLHAPCHVDWAVRGKTGALNVPQLFIFFFLFPSFIPSVFYRFSGLALSSAFSLAPCSNFLQMEKRGQKKCQILLKFSLAAVSRRSGVLRSTNRHSKVVALEIVFVFIAAHRKVAPPTSLAKRIKPSNIQKSSRPVSHFQTFFKK